jgi:lysophospholipase L1-like esterase
MSSTQPDVLHLLCGTNDIWLNSDPQEAEPEIDAMVQQALAGNVIVILATLPPVRFDKTYVLPSTFNTQIATLNSWIRSYATTNQLLLVDYNPVMSDASGQMNPIYTEDGVHPNAAGYQVMTNAVTPIIATINQ